MKISECTHLPNKFAKPGAKTCEEKHFCPFGQRVCLTCGYVGCCDSCSQHLRKHAAETGHQVMAAYPADEHSFIWCYADDDYLEPDEIINLKGGGKK